MTGSVASPELSAPYTNKATQLRINSVCGPPAKPGAAIRRAVRQQPISLAALFSPSCATILRT